MSYSNFLSEIIKNSGYSLRQIANVCSTKYNVNITASYLSKLQTGAQTPASDSVNEAIAKVCKVDPENLLYEAHLEKAPDDVKKIVSELIGYLKNFFLSLYNIEDIKKADKNNEIEKYLNMHDREFLKAMLEQSPLDTDTPLEFNFPLNEEKDVDALFMKFSLGLKMLDNSMFPIIPQGADIEIENNSKLTNGDIVAVHLNEKEYMIRTYVESGDEITLIPANKCFETTTLPKDKVKIKGKVKSYTVKLGGI